LIFPSDESLNARDALTKRLDAGDITDAQFAAELLALDPDDLQGLVGSAMAAQDSGDGAAAWELSWRAAAAHPYAALPFMMMLRSGDDQVYKYLYTGLVELAFGTLERRLRFNEKPLETDLLPPKMREQWQALLELARMQRGDESAEAARVLRPYRLIHELLASAPFGMSSRLVRDILGARAEVAPLLRGVLRGYAQGRLGCGSSNAPAYASLALLGEMGDVESVTALVEFMTDKQDEVSDAAFWAFGRLARTQPNEVTRALAAVLPSMPETDRQSVEYAVSLLPAAHPARGLVADVEVLDSGLESLTLEAFCLVGDQEKEGEGDQLDEGIRVSPPSYKPGRNDPCWCGSGKKYKKCHLADDEGTAEPLSPQAKQQERFTQLQRQIIDFALTFVSRSETLPLMDDFFGDQPPGSQEEAEPFVIWMVHDFVSPKTGRTPIEEYLARNLRTLSASDRQMIEAWAAARLTLYEVKQVRPGVGIRVLDELRGGEYMIHDISSTKQSAAGDHILTRVVEVGDRQIFATNGLSVPSGLYDGFREWLEAEKRESGLEWNSFLRQRSIGFRKKTMELSSAFRDNLVVKTPEGDIVEICKSFWAVRDESEVREACNASPDLDADNDGGFAWLERAAGESDMRRSYGRFAFENGRVVLECMSRQRLERGRALIERLAGQWLKYEGESVQSMASAMRSAPKEAPKSSIPPDVKREIEQKLLNEHYATWPDHPLPALDGKTPREAVKTAQGRTQVRALLDQFENSEEHKRLRGLAYYDFSKIRAALGVKPRE
jgi:hypothetical protein